MRCRLLSAAFCFLPAVSLFGMPPQPEKLRVAVIGLSHDHAWRILGDLAKRAAAPGDIELVGIAEKIPELRDRARSVLDRPPAAPGGAFRSGLTAFYDDFIAMLDQARPQAVFAFGDNREHVAVVRACAARKIHVMMEKPLAPTYALARQAWDAARRGGIKLMVNYWLAWTPATYAAYERVQAGDAGRVWRIQVRFGHNGPIELGVSRHFSEWLNDEQRNGGGAIIDFGCYGANLLRWYLGKPESVSAVRRTFKPQVYKVDDDAVIVANYPNAVGVVEASWNWPQDMTQVHIFGDKGSILGDRESVRLVIPRPTGAETKQVPLPQLPAERQGVVAYFVDAVRNDRPIEGLVGADFNLDVAEILEAAKISARTGRVVRLPLGPAAAPAAFRSGLPAATPGAFRARLPGTKTRGGQ